MNSKFFFLVCVLIIFWALPCTAQKDGKTFKVVIDAGHGGKDPGCLGANTKEKDIVLSVALKTGKLISDNCPNVKVIYTRSTDVFVELYRRAQIANENHADLFISIHCNANDNHSANGIETFVMGLHRSEANQAVARAENSAMLKEANYRDNYDGFDPTSPEAAIAFSLYSSAYLQNSILLADKVQKNLVGTMNLSDRGVKQAGFWVLYKVSMPSILIEMGFLSNLNDEKYLNNDKNRSAVAESIYKAFAAYYTQVTGNKVNVTSVNSRDNTNEQTNTTIGNGNNSNNTLDNQPDKETNAQENPVTNPSAKSDEIRFRVQFMALPDKIPATDKRLKDIPEQRCYFENNLWKYTAGNEDNLQSAKEILSQIKGKYPDAFIIAFKGEEKIPVSEAVKLQKKK